MRSLTDLAESAVRLSLSDHDFNWLHLLLADWQVLADLAAADLVLWLPTDDGRFVAVAHARPGTSATVHVEDIIGLYLPGAREEEMRRALETGQVVKASSARWAGTYSMLETCVPVFHDGRVIAVMTCEANLSTPRLPLGVESWAAEAVDQLCDMVARGEYPYDSTPTVTTHGVPRVLDGVVLLDGDGVVKHATPNASSCFKRLGLNRNVVGKVLLQSITDVLGTGAFFDESLPVVAMGRASWRTEVTVRASTVTMRALPLLNGRERIGAVLLTRDVSEMRRREQELMTKDATIREIHHRVKNNLQTVSALLRLQARRSDEEAVKAALGEAERRVQAIATVHDALSQNVDQRVEFDEVARSVLRLAGAVASTSVPVEVVTIGKFGVLSAEQAQGLASVLNELVANSVEHGYGGRSGVVQIVVNRNDAAKEMIVQVVDQGAGFDGNVEGAGLGTQIVRQVVRGELGGTIEWGQTPGGGTTVTIRMSLA